MLEGFRGAERAVSPVVGVILMVAVTIILAAVVASTVFALAGSNSTTPDVVLTAQYDNSTDTLTVTSQSGDTVAASDVVFTGDVTDVSGADVTAPGASWGGSGTVAAGDSVTVGVDGADYQVRAVYRGDSNTVLATFEGPQLAATYSTP